MAVYQKRFRCRACGETFGHPDTIAVDGVGEINLDCATIHNSALVTEIAANKNTIAIHACNWKADTGEVFSCGIGDFIGLRNISE